ncbi:serine hydrolase domain-containing protein [Neolewinella litorea]|uniref:Class A beta-lactamase-related serine hydrolase n=1 Tax=Neolewinella litorea TaxID=2562452 RepID=A0A4S4NAC5_9BACT|nr:serine hydrolase domain-containing protein [Neolewinella litorea]THH35625.1 class A beta-lactamase-related serine hydrolase [Neolewinella litorea]
MVSKRSYILPLTVLSVFLLGCSPESDLEISVDGVFAHMDSGAEPGCACSVNQNGELVYSNGFGMANLEYDVPIGHSTIFHVASVSKQFTAMAIELLVNDGLVSWDDDVRKYVPEVPDFGTPVTLRHLVHHVSGIRDQWNLLYMAGWRWEADVVTQKDVLDITSRQTSLNFEPGERFLYSNTGYTLLAVVVERQTGQSLREFCRERLFEPLGMSNTHFHDDHEMIVPNRAWGYAPDQEGYLGYRASIPDFDVVGATSLFTTVDDMSRWDKNFYTMEVGGEDAYNRLHDKITLANGDTLDYMHGLGESEYRGVKMQGHGGADAGYRSYFLRFPDHNLTVTVLCNFSSSNPGQLAQEVAEIYLEEYMEAPSEGEVAEIESTPAGNLDNLAGFYVHPLSKAAYEIKLENDTLVFQADQPYKLIQTGENEFVLDGTTTTLELIAGDGSESTARFLPDDEPHYRKDSWTPEPKELAEFEGRFYSSELDTKYHFELMDSSLMFHHRKKESDTMQPLYQNAFRLDGATVHFGEDLTTFTLSDERIWNVKFEKIPGIAVNE